MKILKLYTYRIKVLYEMLKVIAFRIIVAIVKPQKYWVIMERGVEAKDNAYFFYKFMKKKHPEQKVYYIIDKKSLDYDKVKEDAVQYQSLKSYYIMFTAEKIISTHYGKGGEKIPFKYFHLSGLQNKYYFLQHGIIKDDLKTLYRENAPMRLFVCGAKPEYEYVSETFGHPKGVVQYTGLVRFDNLHNMQVKKRILVMPTWRNLEGELFENSEYLQAWNGFLTNKALIDSLQVHNIDLIFYPHYEFQKYLQLFKSVNERIILASSNDYDVQELLKESAVLVTDFSSVYFDFAYMKKPIVYYQFDIENFRKSHYQQGYFDYDTMGFGKVCTREDETIKELLNIIDNGLKMDELYMQRIENFFPLYDTNNAQRVYECIVNQ